MRLWFPLFVTPIATLTQLCANYALVPLACATQRHAPIHAVSAIALALTVAGFVIARNAWRECDVDASPDGATEASRTRFLALVAIALSALMALASGAQWLTAAFIAPCVR